jgi:acetyl esterase
MKNKARAGIIDAPSFAPIRPRLENENCPPPLSDNRASIREQPELKTRLRMFVAIFIVGITFHFSAHAQRFTASSATPTNFPGAESFIYRALTPEPLRLFVVKPEGCRTNERRAAFVYFFGGAWTRGNASQSIGWARMAAKWGMIGIAPDYRTAERFGTTPVESTADARAALRWVEEHAAELSVDTNKIVVGGTSAGGHLALWTAITKAPYGSVEAESPTTKPAALVLVSSASSTSTNEPEYQGKDFSRFGPHIGDLSPLHHLDAKMPPVLMFHGDMDTTVPYHIAVTLRDTLVAASNTCELVTIRGGGHGLPPEWKDKSREMIKEFLEQQKLLATK